VRTILDSSGFLLIDPLFRPVYANPESIKILGYPNIVPDPACLDGILTQRLLSLLPRDIVYSKKSFITQFQSGRRRYTCRAFVLQNHWDEGTHETRIALLLERGLPGPPKSVKKHAHFGGMYEDPFGFEPDPKYCYFGRVHHEVLTSLLALVRENRGAGVLLGQAGMGKTLLLNCLTQKLRAESEIVSIPGSFDSYAELVRAAMALLGVNSPGTNISQNVRHFEAWLVSKYQAGRKVVLICDEAHRSSIEALENLHILTDFQKSQHKLLQVIIAGRQELLEKLTDSRMESINTKANVFCRLSPLDESEVCSYVLHRLRVAGCTRQLFSSDALSAIALYSRGIPLNVNMLCRHALSLAATVNQQLIDEKIVEDSAYDLVLRAQPAAEPPRQSDARGRPAGLLRDRRGLRLVKKPTV
jgi:general secretion pathway protein A